VNFFTAESPFCFTSCKMFFTEPSSASTFITGRCSNAFHSLRIGYW
jgi:hypothetical protein